MGCHLYFSMIPEALVASMLPPEEFGRYLAVGTRKRSRGQAMFLDLQDGFESDDFALANVEERCVPHADGQPKHSLYLGIYRVLERLPLDALNHLWLVTADGRVLELPPSEIPEQFPGRYHLYQEICPVHPLIATALPPVDFTRFITDRSRPVSVPRICFVELDLQGLADDPSDGNADDLPYAHLAHLRDCLVELDEDTSKNTKTVNRTHHEEFPYRCVKSGFFLGDQDGLLYYPFPSRQQLESEYYPWWRSAVGWEH
ncbi:MAG: hypothetical protein ISS72_01110 [Candidatus Brocadiae bacterium]|nr:hypothetical protein [Candidatus Brocadiia bacterium]